ncbi:hypothetical protein V8F20_003977 [Naviculisporaceae sp. PSN 640]
MDNKLDMILHGKKTSAVHETMTMAALVNSQCHDADIKRDIHKWDESNGATQEFCRGAVWNDDPAITLWTDSPDYNWDFTDRLFIEFSQWKNVRDALGLSEKDWHKIPTAWHDSQYVNARSHAGDLQFLHAMANIKGEDAHFTKSRVMLWIEIMYRIAIGEPGFEDHQKLGDIELRDRPQNSEDRFPFRQWFGVTSRPKMTDTVRYMLSRDSSYKFLSIQRRALGSAMHVIQDSYSHAHIRREELQEGKPWKPNKHDHGHEDISGLSVSNLDSLNGMSGVRDGVNACIKLVDFWAARTPWNEGVEKWLDEEVFGLAPNFTPSDHEI